MLKMSELVKLSNTPKSTVLYYIKEGLLPAPVKDKPNFHLYDENCVKLLEFIKYLQSNFNASISQIKDLFGSKDFDLNNPYESLIYSLSCIMGAENEVFSAEALCSAFNLTLQDLDKLVADGLLSPRNGVFTMKERDILAIICRCDKAELEMIKTYARTAEKLAKQEVALTLEALVKSEQKDIKLKHLFDILLVLKPYVLNMQTLNTYQKESA
ncbi:MAG TPA: MerR family transcriptional regulator [Pasteurellaceae bacterium]|nr:MerR family transcriptional regulator [Pasteurellaceae bacterium]